MRTPLNAVVGWMSILRAEGRKEEDLAEGLDVIERNTKAQVQLIEDVLDVSRIVSGKLRVDIRPCDLVDAIHTGVNAVRPAAERGTSRWTLGWNRRPATHRAIRRASSRSYGT
jgi:signal transduction histidine kinase